MSIKDIIIQAGERYASMSETELHREAHVLGKMYECCYIAAAKDLVKAANFLTSNDTPVVKLIKAAYTMVLPFSATVMENALEMRQEFEAEYDKEKGRMVDEEPNVVSASEAVSMAEIAADAVAVRF